MAGDGERGLPGGILKPKDIYATGNPRISGWDGIWCFSSVALNSDLFYNFLSRYSWSLRPNTSGDGEITTSLAISREGGVITRRRNSVSQVRVECGGWGVGEWKISVCSSVACKGIQVEGVVGSLGKDWEEQHRDYPEPIPLEKHNVPIHKKFCIEFQAVPPAMGESVWIPG